MVPVTAGFSSTWRGIFDRMNDSLSALSLAKEPSGSGPDTQNNTIFLPQKPVFCYLCTKSWKLTMKHLISVLALIWVCTACGSAGENHEVTNTISKDSIATSSVPTTLLSRFSDRLQRIVHTDQGLLRGFVPGEPLDSVTRRETAVLEEDSTNYKGYFLENPVNTEVFDIRYFFNPKSHITDSLVLDTYLNSIADSDSLMGELSAYFTTQLGKPLVKQQKLIAWQANSNQVVVRDVGIKQAPGLQIVAKRAFGKKKGI